MRDHARTNSVSEIAMPKICCGLDGLNWNAVRTLVKNVFLDEKIKISVYSLDSSDADNVPAKIGKAVKISPSPKKQEQKSIKDMFESRKRKSDDEHESSKKQKISEGSRKRKSSGNDDSDDDTKAKKSDILPDIFEGWKVFLAEGVEDSSKLKRYVIAFGGEILQDHELESATHVIYPKETSKKLDGGKKHLVQEFLVDSIKLKEVQDYKLYKA